MTIDEAILKLSDFGLIADKRIGETDIITGGVGQRQEKISGKVITVYEEPVFALSYVDAKYRLRIDDVNAEVEQYIRKDFDTLEESIGFITDLLKDYAK